MPNLNTNSPKQVNLSTISSLLGFSESVTGVTFLAFGNGSPDVFSTFAAMRTNSGSLAIGELIGAASFITAVVAGSMALVHPFAVTRMSFLRDVGFFIVAASFSMVFLADGQLQLWECGTMIAFYLFYVSFIAVWQWKSSRNKRLGCMETHARSHFLTPDIVNTAVGRRAQSGDISITSSERNLALAQERGSTFGRSRGSAAYDTARDEDSAGSWMTSVSTNMRLGRPVVGTTDGASNPIRPSLIGALEFRALLASLKHSQTEWGASINLRRYSDNPNLTLAQQQRFPTHLSPELDSARYTSANHDTDIQIHDSRRRAASTNDLLSASNNADQWRLSNSNLSLTPGERSATSENRNRKPDRGAGLKLLKSLPLEHVDAPDAANSQVNSHLAPPPCTPSISPLSAALTAQNRTAMPESQPNSGRPDNNGLRHIEAAGSTLVGDFPPYFDDPNENVLQSRAPVVRLHSPIPEGHNNETWPRVPQDPEKPLRWWPYTFLPSPVVLVSTLFPTLYPWVGKSYSQKLLGVLTAPSVLLLTITLPVVEPTDIPEPPLEHDETNEPEVSTRDNTPSHQRHLIGDLLEQTVSTDGLNNMRLGSTNVIAEATSRQMAEESDSLPERLEGVSNEQGTAVEYQSTSTKGWSRWLVAIQIFMAPFFVILVTWANIDEALSWVTLLTWTAFTMLGSLLTLLAVILTTTDSTPPRYRPLLCFAGFVVSVAWISTIANEVVGILKAFGIILGMSEAILGLTIFAIGNRYELHCRLENPLY